MNECPRAKNSRANVFILSLLPCQEPFTLIGCG